MRGIGSKGSIWSIGSMSSVGSIGSIGSTGSIYIYRKCRDYMEYKYIVCGV